MYLACTISPLPVSPHTSLRLCFCWVASVTTVLSSEREPGRYHWGPASVFSTAALAHTRLSLQHLPPPISCNRGSGWLHLYIASSYNKQTLNTSMSTQSKLHSLSSAEANDFIASRMGRYPVQRQIFPSKLSSTSCLVGFGLAFSKLQWKQARASPSVCTSLLTCTWTWRSQECSNHIEWRSIQRPWTE